MTITESSIKGAFSIQPKVFGDNRGYFFESYSKRIFEEHGILDLFVQDNISCSQKGVLRGLHFQKEPYAQSKLVHVLKGSVLDVIVDIRKNSPTYGKHFSLLLSEENKKMLYVPTGCAHGFLTLEDHTIFHYKCGNYYRTEAEGSVRWNSMELNIDWGIENPILSEKDKIAPLFSDFETPFHF